MPQSIFIFDFGTNEEAAQQARHKVEAWQQGFRLGKKMSIKFEREHVDASESAEAESGPAEKPKPSNKKSANPKGAPAAEAGGDATDKASAEKHNSSSRVRVLVRLDFSDHEKLTLQRWLDRIPAEEPFKSAKSEAIRTGNPDFAKTVELFDSLK
jgi:pyruvate/2-oxoglutarate dehydrogenase complex dihydrolipoamide acyltransferase (E2) component